MRFASDLLYRWVQAVRTGNATPLDSELEVFPTISPVVLLPGPLGSPIAVDTTVVERESFSFDLGSTRGASSAEVSTLVVSLGRGLWLFVVTLQHHADFTSAPGANGAHGIISDGVANNVMMRFPNIANVSQRGSLLFPLLLPNDAFEFRLLQGATGVAQTMHSSLDGFGLRLN